MKAGEREWVECQFVTPSRFIAQLRMPVPLDWHKADIVEAYKCFNAQNVPRNYLSRGFKLRVCGQELPDGVTLGTHLLATNAQWRAQPVVVSLILTEESAAECSAEAKLQVLLEAITLHQIAPSGEYKARHLRGKLKAILQEVRADKLPPERHQVYHLLKFALDEPSEVTRPIHPMPLEREVPLQPAIDLLRATAKQHKAVMTLIPIILAFVLFLTLFWLILKNPIWLAVPVFLSLSIPQKHKGKRQAEKDRKRILKSNRAFFAVFFAEVFVGFLLNFSPFFDSLHFQNHLAEAGLLLAQRREQKFSITDCFCYPEEGAAREVREGKATEREER